MHNGRTRSVQHHDKEGEQQNMTALEKRGRGTGPFEAAQLFSICDTVSSPPQAADVDDPVNLGSDYDRDPHIHRKLFLRARVGSQRKLVRPQKLSDRPRDPARVGRNRGVARGRHGNDIP